MVMKATELIFFSMRQTIAKSKYRLRNWWEYNAALIQRGSLALRMIEEALMTWREVSRTDTWRLRPRPLP
jgi:hypothetical protein